MNTTLQARPPWEFYRAQHEGSFTYYSKDGGFQSKGHYHMRYGHWINARKLNRHLDWKDRSAEKSPFISVFDNQGQAEERAQLFLRQKKPQVFVAKINARSLKQTVLEIEFADKTVRLPAWESNEADFMVISTPDVRQHLGVLNETSQTSEWFALDWIPKVIIENIITY